MVDRHPLLQDIWRKARSCISFHTTHIYHEANNVVDWVASYMAEHVSGTSWVDYAIVPLPFCDILFSNLLGYIRTRLL